MLDPRFLPAWASVALGRRRRARGLYDGETAALFRSAARRRPTPANLVAEARFRRDLGEQLTPAEADRLLTSMGRLRGSERRHAIHLLCESGRSDDVLASVPDAALRALAPTSPPIADALGIDGPLATLQREQDLWRAELADTLVRHRGSLCVVGNAGSLVGSGLGEAIDGHAHVTRFNHYASASTREHDIGARVDVWVRAPDLAGFVPEKPPSWVVLSGPDPRYHLARWHPIVSLLDAGSRVVTIPLAVWKSLVTRLEAPPSAGLLYLAWLIELLDGDAAAVTVAGFQDPSRNETASAYHHALPEHRPSGRHRWPAERAVLGEWHARGLRFLGAA